MASSSSLSPRPHKENTNPNPSSSPKPITRSEPASPYPTTFVQADTSSFKQVVQMLTGAATSSSTAAAAKPTSDSPSKPHHIPPIKPSKSGFKLYERRNSIKNLKINPLIPSFGPHTSGFSPRKPEILSPSLLDFPSLALSPVTPLLPDPFDRARGLLDTQAEDRAIKEKGFFFHPSPASTPRDGEPKLLSLFPTTSPRAAASGSSSTTTSPSSC